MIHAREDYNRIQDPAGKIADDEPVFLLRAKDMYMPDTLDFWANQVQPVDFELAMSIRRFAQHAREWQRQNGCKTPDTPNDQKWHVVVDTTTILTTTAGRV